MGYLLDLTKLQPGKQQARKAQLRESFDVVAAAFQCSSEEIAEAWSIAMGDLDTAEASFNASAEMLAAGWNPLEQQSAAFQQLGEAER